MNALAQMPGGSTALRFGKDAFRIKGVGTTSATKTQSKQPKRQEQKATMLRRTGFKRKAPVSLKRSPMKRRAPKKRPGHDKAMLEACRGAHCYLEVDGVCCGDTATVVPCHANWSEYGKGAGLKAEDRFTVPGCCTCHSWLDQGKAPREEKRQIWEAAYKRWAAYRDRGD